MRRKLVRCMFRYFRSSMVLAAVLGMFAQMWMLPELMAQELNEQQRERNIEEHERELRTYIDTTLSVDEQSRMALNRVDECSTIALERLDAGEDTEELIKDLERLSEKIQAIRIELVAKHTQRRARLERLGISPTVIDRQRTIQSEMLARFSELEHELEDIQRASSNLEQALRIQKLQSLLRSDNADAPAPDSDLDTLPRHSAKLSALGPNELDLFRSTWRFAAAGDIISSLLSGIGNDLGAPHSDDLAESVPEFTAADISSGGDVYAVAESLEKDPVKIYEYLRNEVVFEPYWGSIKGARKTLTEEAGNSIDIASATVALLRASGIHSRYVFGTIKLTVEEAGEWIGVNDPGQIVKTFTDNGIPVDVLETSGGKPSVLEIGHVWVKAHVDYFPYRGEQEVEGDTWIELDPSFKRHAMTGRRDLEYEAGIDPQTLLHNISLGTVIPNNDAVHDMDPNGILNSELSGLDSKFRNLLAAGNLKTESAFRQRYVAEERFGILPVTDDYERYYPGRKTLRSLPDVLRNTLSIRLVDAQGNDQLELTPGSGATAFIESLAALADKKITLSYAPATTQDEAVIEEFGSGEDGIPAGLIALVPELRIDLDGNIAGSEIVAKGTDPETNNTVMMGQPQWLIVQFTATDGSTEQITHEITAGGYHALVLDAQTITSKHLEDGAATLRDIASSLAPNQSDPTDGKTPEELRQLMDDTLGETLHSIGLAYFHQVDRFNQISAGSLDVATTRLPSFVRVSWEPSIIQPVSGIPGDAKDGRVSIEVGRDVYIPISIDTPANVPAGAMSAQAQFLFNVGLTSSVLEHNAVMQTLPGTEAYSTARVITEANDDTSNGGNFLYTFTSDNKNEVDNRIDNTKVTDSVRLAIQHAAASGYEVTAPKHPITTGISGNGSIYGYVVRDPGTGASDFVLVRDDTQASNNTTLSAADLIRFGLASNYVTVTNSAALWMDAVEDATTNVGISYLPPITNINDWYKNQNPNVNIDPTTTVAAVMAVSGRISELTNKPAILNFVAGPQLFTTTEGAGFQVTSDVLRATEWTFTVNDAEPSPLVILSTDPDQTASKIDVAINSLNVDELKPVNPDGTYQYTLTAEYDNGDPGIVNPQATPIRGSFTLDDTAPNVIIDPIRLPDDIQGTLLIEGTVDDTHLKDYTLTLTDVSGGINDGKVVLTKTYSDTVNEGVLEVINTRLYPDSTYQLSISAEDVLGHTKTTPYADNLVFNNGVDLTNPTIEGIVFYNGSPGSPIASGATYTGPELRIEASAKDLNSEIVAIDIEINGKKAGTITSLVETGGIYTGSLDVLHTQALSRGVNTVIAKAIDAAGNVSDPGGSDHLILDGPIHDFVVNPEYLTPNTPVLTVSADIGARQFWTVNFVNADVSSSDIESPSPFDSDNLYQGSSDIVSVQIDMSGVSLTDWPADNPYRAKIDLANTPYTEDFNIRSTSEPPIARITNPRERDLTTFEDSLPIITDGYFQLRGVADDPDADSGEEVYYRISLLNDEFGHVRYLTPLTDIEFNTDGEDSYHQQQVTGKSGNDLLAEVDFTGIQNGIYHIKLEVKDQAGNNNESDPVIRRFALATDLKIGNFAFSQQDMTIPTGGVPLSVIRSYNSLNVSGSHDFGPGWSYALGEPDIRLDEGPRVNTQNMGLSPIAGTPHVDLRNDDNRNRNVTLTLPDGRRVTFTYTLIPADDTRNTIVGDFVFDAEYISPQGVDATLETLRTETYVHLPFQLAPYWEGGAGQDVESYDFSGYRLTLEDGTVYTFLRKELGSELQYNQGSAQTFHVNAAYGDLYLDNIQTTSGDTIRFDRGDDNLIEYVNYEEPGASIISKQIYFERDGDDGRVTGIYSPDRLDGTGKPLTEDTLANYRYEYYSGSDGAPDGYLKAVRKLVDSTAVSDEDAYEATMFFYEFADGISDVNDPDIIDDNDDFKHYITKIIDARGVTVMKSRFDENGVLGSTEDAEGNGIGIDYDVDESEGLRVANINDREGNLTQHFYDDKGNVVKTVDALKHITKRSYDDEGNTLTETNHLGHTTTFEYDSKGNRTFVKDPLGNTTETDFEYWPNGQIKSQTVTNAESETTTSTFDGKGNLVSTVDNEGNTSYNTYDARNRLTETSQTVRDDTASGGTRTIKTSFKYFNSFDPTADNGLPAAEAPHEIDDDYPNGEATRVMTYIDEAGTISTSQYTVTDSRGNQVEFYYKWIDPSGTLSDRFVRSISEYDDAGRVIKTLRKIEDTSGNSLLKDDQNQTVPELVLSETTYNALGKVETSTDQYGNVTYFYYDARGNQVQQMSPVQIDEYGVVTHYQITRTVYDNEGRSKYTLDPYTISTSEAIDASLPLSGGDPTFATRTHYDPLGRAVKTERLSGVTFTLEEDPDNPGSGVYASAATSGGTSISSTRSRYDAAGRLIASFTQIDDSGNEQVTRYEYDDAGRQERTIVPFGVQDLVTSFEYDKTGRQLFSTDPANRRTGFKYDAQGRRIQTTFHDGTFTTTEYDGRGLRVGESAQRAVGEAPKTRRFEYDHQGRLSAVILPAVDDGTGTNTIVHPRTEYTYDIYGNQASIRENITQVDDTDSNTIDDTNATESHFRYDELHRQTARTFPNSGDFSTSTQVETTAYNLYGQTETITDFENQEAEFVYDALGRAKTKNLYADGSGSPDVIIRMAYDNDGRQLSILDPRHGTTQWVYDDRGRVETITTPEGSINYDHDAVTNQKTDTWTANSHTEYDYDDLGRLYTVKQVKRNGSTVSEQTTYEYDDNGSRKSITYANGVKTSYTYDPVGRLETLEHRNGPSLLRKYAYELDTDGKRKQVVESDISGTLVTINYQHDDLNRLIQESSTTPTTGTVRDFTHDYVYDTIGNRLSKDDGTDLTEYVYNDLNQLEREDVNSVTAVTYTYNDNGAMTRKNNTADTEDYVYTYNLDDRLKSAQFNGGTATTYTYNPSGIRVSDGATNFLVDPNNHTGYAQVLEEKTGVTVTRTYTLGDDVISQGASGGSVHHLLYDGHGSTRALRAHGTPATLEQAYSFDAYGNALGNIATALTPLLYAGEYLASSANQYYLRARHYDTASGRFNRLDPFAGNHSDPQSLHKYTYAHSDPVHNIDPTGKSFISFLIGVTAMSFLAGLVGGAVTLAAGGTVKEAIGTFIGDAFGTALALLLSPLLFAAFGPLAIPIAFGIGSLFSTAFSIWYTEGTDELFSLRGATRLAAAFVIGAAFSFLGGDHLGASNSLAKTIGAKIQRIPKIYGNVQRFVFKYKLNFESIYPRDLAKKVIYASRQTLAGFGVKVIENLRKPLQDSAVQAFVVSSAKIPASSDDGDLYIGIINLFLELVGMGID